MHTLSAEDHGREIDWGRTSTDYGRYRSGYPASLYDRLTVLGIGVPGQRVLDLGTGTGLLARELARRGCRVTGVDIAGPQIEEARRRAREEGVTLDFRVAPAESTELPDASFDVVTAAQCWLYFPRPRIIDEVKRLLAPGGRLVTCHLCWLPREDAVARQTEALVLAHNPDWTAAGYDGVVPAQPAWSADDFVVEAMFFHDEDLAFTHAGWRGRIRACRGIGATLTPAQVEAFDREHAVLLARIAPDPFTVRHRVDAHIFRIAARL
ncbi:MAG: class I SAM-dependent methyltransferase [Candidatus Schekmanbacteria bacterium]|nr:class I SAM-dependent methyltransferase [Candidatus Schekmanbacteria bacterium]